MSREKVAERVSDIFNPYYSSAPFFLLIAIRSTRGVVAALLLWLPLALFFSLLPMWDIKRRIRLGTVRDAHINRREDRIKPFLFSLACAMFGLVAVYGIGAPTAVKAVAWAVVLTGALITAITIRWKVSLHAAGISSISTILIVLYGMPAVSVVLLVPVVFWARLTLKRHTPAQLVVGSLLAVLVALSVLWMFGLVSS